MNGVRQAWLVAARELRERGRSRVFLFSVLLMLVGAAGAIVLPALLDTGPEARDVGITGSGPAALAPALQAQAEAVDTTIRVHRYDTVADGEAAVRDGEADVLVVDARQLEWPKRADEQLQALVTGAIQLVTVRERAAAAGISPDELLAVLAAPSVSNVELGQVAGRSPGDENAAFIMTLVLFGAISTFAAMVLTGVVEEKSSRTVEVLLARMPARSLLAGKIVGIGMLGLAQVAALGLVALVAGAVVDSVDIPAVRPVVVAWAVVWFLLGYALYATVYGTLGALATRTEDASSIAGPVTIVLVLSFMVPRHLRQHRHHVGTAGVVVPGHRTPGHAVPRRDGCCDLVGPGHRRRSHARHDRGPRRARWPRLHPRHPPHRREPHPPGRLARRHPPGHSRGRLISQASSQVTVTAPWTDVSPGSSRAGVSVARSAPGDGPPEAAFSPSTMVTTSPSAAPARAARWAACARASSQAASSAVALACEVLLASSVTPSTTSASPTASARPDSRAPASPTDAHRTASEWRASKPAALPSWSCQGQTLKPVDPGSRSCSRATSATRSAYVETPARASATPASRCTVVTRTTAESGTTVATP